MADEDPKAKAPKSAQTPKAKPSRKAKPTPGAAKSPPKSTPADEKPATVMPPPAQPSTNKSWLASRSVRWSAAIIIGLGAMIWFQTIIGDKEKEIAGLRAKFETASQAVGEYPDAVAALKAIKAEYTAVEAALKKAKAEEQSQKSLKAEVTGLQAKKDELSSDIQVLSKNLQAAMELLKATSGKVKPEK